MSVVLLQSNIYLSLQCGFDTFYLSKASAQLFHPWLSLPDKDFLLTAV